MAGGKQIKHPDPVGGNVFFTPDVWEIRMGSGVAVVQRAGWQISRAGAMRARLAWRACARIARMCMYARDIHSCEV